MATRYQKKQETPFQGVNLKRKSPSFHKSHHFSSSLSAKKQSLEKQRYTLEPDVASEQADHDKIVQSLVERQEKYEYLAGEMGLLYVTMQRLKKMAVSAGSASVLNRAQLNIEARTTVLEASRRVAIIKYKMGDIIRLKNSFESDPVQEDEHGPGPAGNAMLENKGVLAFTVGSAMDNVMNLGSLDLMTMERVNSAALFIDRAICSIGAANCALSASIDALSCNFSLLVA